jgi:LPXTG-motif cell wall-anchored protein
MRTKLHRLFGALSVCAMVLVAGTASGQTQTRTSTTTKFEVISVVGNQLVIRTPEGTKEYAVPEDFRFTVDGKELSVHQLKPGMAGTATVTTLTTSKTVQVVEQRSAKVMQANGNSVILRAQDGTFKLFTSEDAAKYKIQITKDGKPIEFQQLRANDLVSATFVTDKVRTMTQQEVDARLAADPPPAAKAAAPAPAPTMSKPAPAPAAAPAPAPAATPKTLPKTASSIPTLALAGAVLLAIGASLTFVRRRRNA